MDRIESLINARITQVNRIVNAIIKEEQPNTEYGDFELSQDGEHWNLKSYFCKLPFKHNSKKNNLCVLINSRIKVMAEGKNIILDHYMTEVSYLKIEKLSNPRETLRPLSGFHFDYEGFKNNHPIFHAQHKKKTYKRFIENTPSFKCDEPEEIEESHGAIRIPTSQMDPISVLVMIIADHIISHEDSYQKFKDFISQIDRLIFPMKLPNCSAPIATDNIPTQIPKWYPQAIQAKLTH